MRKCKEIPGSCPWCCVFLVSFTQLLPTGRQKSCKKLEALTSGDPATTVNVGERCQICQLPLWNRLNLCLIIVPIRKLAPKETFVPSCVQFHFFWCLIFLWQYVHIRERRFISQWNILCESPPGSVTAQSSLKPHEWSRNRVFFIRWRDSFVWCWSAGMDRFCFCFKNVNNSCRVPICILIKH